MNDIIGYGVPLSYDYINSLTAPVSPSTVHIRDTGASRFFYKYLFQRAISVFKWNLPETWDRDYFLYILYSWGFISVVNTNKFGVIPQACSLRGYDVFYRPNTAVITNPVFAQTYEKRIGVNCTLFKLQPDYTGICDIVQYYADKLALCAETLDMNLLNSHLSYVFTTSSKNGAETFKKMIDKIYSGEPAVVIDKEMLKDDGGAPWELFDRNIKQNYIATDILTDMRTIISMFDTEIGIPNANTEKRERLISDEVNANNFETKSKCELWLESLKKTCEETKKMFDIEISVDWRCYESEESVNEIDY